MTFDVTDARAQELAALASRRQDTSVFAEELAKVKNAQELAQMLTEGTNTGNNLAIERLWGWKQADGLL